MTAKKSANKSEEASRRPHGTEDTGASLRHTYLERAKKAGVELTSPRDKTLPEGSGRGHGQRFKPGPDPRRGRGPKTGAANAGRPTDEFKRRMAAMVSREDTLRELELILSDGSNPQFLKAFQFAVERAYGRPVQAVDSESHVTVWLEGGIGDLTKDDEAEEDRL